MPPRIEKYAWLASIAAVTLIVGSAFLPTLSARPPVCRNRCIGATCSVDIGGAVTNYMTPCAGFFRTDQTGTLGATGTAIVMYGVGVITIQACAPTTSYQAEATCTGGNFLFTTTCASSCI